MFTALVYFTISIACVRCGSIRLFLPDTNFNNVANWAEGRQPCDGTHIAFPPQSPRILLNGTDRTYHLTDVTLPLNGELLLDDRVTLRPAELDPHSSAECSVVSATYSKETPDFWYDPANWCTISKANGDGHCLSRLPLEASIIPAATDTVVFRRGSSFYVGVRPGEPTVLVRMVLLRGKTYRNSIVFRQAMRRSSVSGVTEFENVKTKQPPLVEIQGEKCRPAICDRNSNLDRMSAICKYISCKPTSCAKPVKPEGSCCEICGTYFVIDFRNSLLKDRFEKWFFDFAPNVYQNKWNAKFDLLSTNRLKYQLTITVSEEQYANIGILANDVATEIYNKKGLYGIDKFEGITVNVRPKVKGHMKGVLTLLLLPVAVVVILGFAYIFRKRICTSSMSSLGWPTITIPTFRFPNINVSFKSDTGVVIDDSASAGGQAIELEDREVAFDNPMFTGEEVKDSNY